MNKVAISLVLLLVLVSAILFFNDKGLSVWPAISTQSPEPEIIIFEPQPEDLISSPLIIEGKVRGFWFFEASFPISLLDGFGNVVKQDIVQVETEWMTTDFVSFKKSLDFILPATNEGILILHNDNPSGLPEHDKELRIPIRFR